ncbi:MAG TPA: carboxypeptidase-like regulatory domain-containing protein [Vicinamibacterales bacterium]|nr:carboxypeptidase-like regulatory domain-containing protein [Vicinamibacterales bacterium]
MYRAITFAMAAVTVAAAAFAQTPPAGVPGTVTLTRTEYDRLLDLSTRRPGGPETAPVSAALARADVRARVEGTTARSMVRLDGEVLRAGIASVPLIKNATVLDARLDNRPLPLVSQGGAHVGLIAGPGPFTATLEIGAPLAFQPGRASFLLPAPMSGSAVATIDVPGEQADVHLSSGLILGRRATNGRTIVDATLTPGVTTEVWWSTHDYAASAGARDLRMLADVKSIVSLGDADIRLISLVNVTVVQGEPERIAVAIPAGYEVTSATGPSLERTEPGQGTVTLFVADPGLRRHQFLISLERPHGGGSFKLDTGLPTIAAAQRETGEVAIEGLGPMEVTSPEMPGLRRIDVRELDPALASVARQSLLAAYRYQRAADEPVSLALDVRRFADAAVLSAVAERGVATTLVTPEGRALTEITLYLRNRAQAYMKVSLPPGAAIVSAEVEGAAARPAEGIDGARVPLLRPGFRPSGLYIVSFVYQHSGAPFLKKGDMRMELAKMDVPVNVLEWELFLPDRFRADRFAGNTIALAHLPGGVLAPVSAAVSISGSGGGSGGGVGMSFAIAPLPQPDRGQMNGRIVDERGAVLPGVTVVIEGAGQKQEATTASDGSFLVTGVPSGAITVTAELSGFVTQRRGVQFDQHGVQLNFVMRLSALSETVQVMAESAAVQSGRRDERPSVVQAPSANVQNLQRRAAGVLPVRMDVPRSGTSHRFVRPLVIDEATTVTFRYKRR